MKHATKPTNREANLTVDAGVAQELIAKLITDGKSALDALCTELGRELAQAVMLIEREEITGPKYHPHGEYRRHTSQWGTIYVGGKKERVKYPRIRSAEATRAVPVYERLRDPKQFSAELLAKSLRGLSARKYGETIGQAADALGVSKSAVSRHVVEATAQQLEAFVERSLADFEPFALMLDTVHRGGMAFVVALGIDVKGYKRALGFWEGATENSTLCEELLCDLERRGLKLSDSVIFVVDGGKGIQKALKSRYGEYLLLQRCSVHKDRNIQAHLPKRLRSEAHRRYRRALEMRSYDDAKAELESFEKWLREKNESAAASLREALENLLTLHKLCVPRELRQALHTTNAIESMFSMVRSGERNVKHYRSSNMAQRWLAATLLDAERRFRRVRGFNEIGKVRERIEQRKNR